MGLLPLVLILLAAGAHAGWNLLAKQAAGGLAFVGRRVIRMTLLAYPAWHRRTELL